MPERIQRRRAKGFIMPAEAIYVGRPSKWGNPWRLEPRGAWLIGPDGSGSTFTSRRDAATAAVHAYQTWLVDGEYRYVEWLQPREVEHLATLRNRISVDLSCLRFHDLACWCPLDQPCHADVLLELANEEAHA